MSHPIFNWKKCKRCKRWFDIGTNFEECPSCRKLNKKEEVFENGDRNSR